VSARTSSAAAENRSVATHTRNTRPPYRPKHCGELVKKAAPNELTRRSVQPAPPDSHAPTRNLLPTPPGSHPSSSHPALTTPNPLPRKLTQWEMAVPRQERVAQSDLCARTSGRGRLNPPVRRHVRALRRDPAGTRALRGLESGPSGRKQLWRPSSILAQCASASSGVGLLPAARQRPRSGRRDCFRAGCQRGPACRVVSLRNVDP